MLLRTTKNRQQIFKNGALEIYSNMSKVKKPTIYIYTLLKEKSSDTVIPKPGRKEKTTKLCDWDAV